LPVNFFEAALVFAGIPLLVIVVVGILTVGRHRAGARVPYKPGGSWIYSDRLYAGDTPVEITSDARSSSFGGARGTW
jgi:hypothetical protein